MAVNDLWRLAVKMKIVNSSNELVNVLHYLETQEGTTYTGPESLVNCFNASLLADYRFVSSLVVQFRSLTISEMPSGLVVHEAGLDNSIGNVTGDPMPYGTSQVVTWRTATPGRRGRGRTYLPTPGEANSDGNGPGSGYLSVVADWADAALVIQDTAANSTFQLQVWSEADQEARPVTSYTPRAIWGNLRSRRT